MKQQVQNGNVQFVDLNGLPLANGTVDYYYPGTLIPAPTRQDQEGTIANTHPIQLDSRGQAIVWADGTLRQIVKDAKGVTILDKVVSTISAANINFLQAGVLATPRTVQDKCRDIVSAFDFMTPQQISAVKNKEENIDVTDQLKNAINFVLSSGGGEIFLPPGTYKISDTLIIDTGNYASGIIIRGAGRNTTIIQTGGNKDAIHFSSTQFLQNSGIRDMQIISSENSGHVINIVFGCTTCFFDNLDLIQSNPNKAIFYGDWSIFGGGVFDTKWRGGSWYCASTSKEAGVRFKCSITSFNENIFENLRCHQANFIQFFHITSVAGSQYWLYNNTFKNINFETCKGGGFLIQSANRWKLENISFWDANGSYTNHLIDFLGGAGNESEGNTLINVGRNGDSLAPGVCDIRMISGQDTVIINCFTSPSDSPVYDFNNKRTTIIGYLAGVHLNKTSTIWLGGQFGGIQFPGTLNGTSLNYYDEGSALLGLTGFDAPPKTVINTLANWTRIGKQVTISGVFGEISLTGAAGRLKITGLPFPCGNVNSIGSIGLFGLGQDPSVGLIVSGTSEILLVKAANIADGISASPGINQFVYFSISYSVNS